jgi:LuxR family maltose regulon positive regulatory protein
MGASTRRTAQRETARESTGILATKLFVPRLSLSFVPRRRLVNVFEGGRSSKLTLVCAPAGFGKTAALAEWVRAADVRAAWLSVDAGDNDAVRFWRHAIVALDSVRPGLADHLTPLLNSAGASSIEALMDELINAIATEPTDIVLVLDDYHVIDADAVHACVQFLLEHAPPQLHLAISTRADPPLAVARLRGRGELAEVRAMELRFTLEEASLLLRSASGVDVPTSVVSLLTERTEGWAVGLELSALSLRGQEDASRFASTFSGSHRFVLDYLTEEILNRLDEHVRAFLLETSVLERLSGALCDAITNRTDSRQRLEAIESAGLFLVPLDDVREWWRYHHLFADLLRARMLQAAPHRVPELHRTAADWYAAHGLIEDAVHHALCAGDHVGAARAIEQKVDELLLRTEGQTLQRWLDALPAEVVATRPRLLLARSRLALLAGDVESVEHALEAAERAFAVVPDEPYAPSVGRGRSMLTNVGATIALGRADIAGLHGDAAQTRALALHAQATLDADEWLLQSFARWHLTVADWLDGRVAEAELGFAERARQWSAAGEDTLAAWSLDRLGQVQCARGRLDSALATYRPILAASDDDRAPFPAVGIAHVGMAQIAYERDELEQAEEHATRGIGFCQRLAFTQSLATGWAVLAWIRDARGDTAGARSAMSEATRVAPSASAPSLLNPIPAEQARLWLVQGDVLAAERWCEERGLASSDAPGYARERDYLALARVLIERGRADLASQLLERLDEQAQAQDRTGSVIEIQMLSAAALAAVGNRSRALSVLSSALMLAEPRGYVRMFVRDGAVRHLLRDVVGVQRHGRSVSPQYLIRLARAVDREPASGAPPARAHALLPELSEREHEVLRLLVAGKQNHEIASELYVTLNTVKKHLTHIFDKLGASNRTEAAARARDLGLLS